MAAAGNLWRAWQPPVSVSLTAVLIGCFHAAGSNRAIGPAALNDERAAISRLLSFILAGTPGRTAATALEAVAGCPDIDDLRRNELAQPTRHGENADPRHRD